MRHLTIAFTVLLTVGLVLTFTGYALDRYYGSHLRDVNGDGVVDWHDCDVNNDGRVDILDVLIIENNFGNHDPSPLVHLDLNGDGVINQMDAQICAAHFTSNLDLLSLSFTDPYAVQGDFFIIGLVITALSIVGVAVSVLSKKA